LYFRKLIAGEHLSLGEVMRGRVNGWWLVNVARRIEDATGRLTGVLAIGTRLEHFQDALRLDNLPAGSVVRVLSEDGIVIAQNVNGPNWIGRDLSKVETVLRHMRAKEITEVVAWTDGVERITGSATAHRVPWLVSVGLPGNVAWAAIAASLWWGALTSPWSAWPMMQSLEWKRFCAGVMRNAACSRPQSSFRSRRRPD
jgi:hypothetical protein